MYKNFFSALYVVDIGGNEDITCIIQDAVYTEYLLTSKYVALAGQAVYEALFFRNGDLVIFPR